MKKQQIAAAACLVAGAIGFAAVYSTQKPGKDEIPTEISQTSSIVEPTEKKDTTETDTKRRLRDKNGTGRISCRAAGKSAAHGKTAAFCP